MPGIMETLMGNDTVRFLYNNSGLRHEVESGCAVIPADTRKAWIRTVDNYGRDGTGPAGIGVLTRVIEPKQQQPRHPDPHPEPAHPAPAPPGQPGGNGGGHMTVDDVNGHLTIDPVTGRLIVEPLTGTLNMAGLHDMKLVYEGPTEFGLKGPNYTGTPCPDNGYKDGVIAALLYGYNKENMMRALTDFLRDAYPHLRDKPADYMTHVIRSLIASLPVTQRDLAIEFGMMGKKGYNGKGSGGISYA